jgi:hypothetical protein
VVWVTGTTEGLRWELRHLREALPPEKLVLWAHPHLLGLAQPQAEQEWTRFCETLGSVLPVPLPRELGDARFFYFQKDWTAFRISARGPNADAAAILKILEDKDLARPIARRERLKRAYEYGVLGIFGLMVAAFALSFLFDD